MAERHVRGYALLGTTSFVEGRYDAPTRERIRDGLPPHVRATATSGYKRVEWYPIEHFSAFLRGIALAHEAEGEPAMIDALAACGSHIAEEASNTFLKLFMRVLTPTLFAKKLPSVWSRDHDFGAVVSDVTRVHENILLLRVEDVEGYDFIGPLSIGYFRFVIGAMGKKNLNVDMKGWSFDAPGPRAIDYTLTWT